jgi:hypothetical protein
LEVIKVIRQNSDYHIHPLISPLSIAAACLLWFPHSDDFYSSSCLELHPGLLMTLESNRMEGLKF